MQSSVRVKLLFVCAALAMTAAPAERDRRHRVRHDPSLPFWTRPSPSEYVVKLSTTKGTILLRVDRALAPIGADRFYHLVESGFYDDSRFFRVINGRFAQFGIAGYPSIA